MLNTNPHKPQSDEWKKFEALKTLKDYQKAEQNPNMYVQETQNLLYNPTSKELLSDELKLKDWLGIDKKNTLSYGLAQMAAEGGSIEPVGDLSLLKPDPDPYLEEEGIYTDSTEGYLDGLRDILGEEDYVQLESAMMDYPVVETVARMAVYGKDNDGEGEVDGIGGPKDDLVPARLSPGEFVFSKEAVDIIGVGVLEQIHEEAKAQAAMQAV